MKLCFFDQESLQIVCKDLRRRANFWSTSIKLNKPGTKPANRSSLNTVVIFSNPFKNSNACTNVKEIKNVFSPMASSVRKPTFYDSNAQIDVFEFGNRMKCILQSESAYACHLGIRLYFYIVYCTLIETRTFALFVGEITNDALP